MCHALLQRKSTKRNLRLLEMMDYIRPIWIKTNVTRYYLLQTYTKLNQNQLSGLGNETSRRLDDSALHVGAHILYCVQNTCKKACCRIVFWYFNKAKVRSRTDAAFNTVNEHDSGGIYVLSRVRMTIDRVWIGN
jgi:hypothetical protein